MARQLALPDRCGLELGNAVRGSRPQAVVDVPSRICDGTSAIRVLEAGARAYVHNPFSFEEMAARS